MKFLSQLSQVSLVGFVGVIGLLAAYGIYVSRSTVEGSSRRCSSDACGSIRVTLTGKDVEVKRGSNIKLYYEVRSPGPTGSVVDSGSIIYPKLKQVFRDIPIGNNYAITLRSLSDHVEPDFDDLSNPLVLADKLEVRGGKVTDANLRVRKRTTGDLIIFLSTKPGTVLSGTGKIADVTVWDEHPITGERITREGSFIFNKSNSLKIPYLPSINKIWFDQGFDGQYRISLTNINQAYKLQAGYNGGSYAEYNDYPIYNGVTEYAQFRLQDASQPFASPSLPTTGITVSFDGSIPTFPNNTRVGRLIVTHNGEPVDYTIPSMTISPIATTHFDLPAGSGYAVEFDGNFDSEFGYEVDDAVANNTNPRRNITVSPSRLEDITFTLKRASR